MKILESAAVIALSPLNRAMYSGALVVSKVTPGDKGQCRSLVFEVAKRCLLSITSLFCICVAIPLTPIAYLLFWLNHQFGEREVLVKGVSDLRDFPPDKLRIGTYNVALLPDWIAVRNRIKEGSKRINLIAKAILENDLDVVCLQEAFDKRLVHKLSIQIKKRFPHQIYNVAPDPIKLNSGLAIFSRFSLSSFKFIPHPILGGACKYSRKGVLNLKIEISKNKTIDLFNTHLNGGASEFPDGGTTPRKQQIEALIKNIGRQESILVGDFNYSVIDRSDEEESDFSERRLGEIFPQKTNLGKSTVFDKDDLFTGFAPDVESWKDEKDRELDRIFSNSTIYTLDHTFCDNAYGGSDHKLVIGVFNSAHE